MLPNGCTALRHAGGTNTMKIEEHVKPKLVTVAGAAVYLGRTQKAIIRMYQEGKITPLRIGDNRISFEVAELDALIAKAKRESN